jgi:hypothetical protein
MAQANDDHTTVDITQCDTAELVISAVHDRTSLRLHIDGKLRARVYRIGGLTLDDRRPPDPHSAAEKAAVEEAIRLAAAAVLESSVPDRRAVEERALQKLRQLQRDRQS